jgi:hypothetical protein
MINGDLVTRAGYQSHIDRDPPRQEPRTMPPLIMAAYSEATTAEATRLACDH